MCHPDPQRNAIYYLREMPHFGEHDLLVEACEALGFDIRRQPSGAFVTYQDYVVATIVGDKLIPESLVMDQLAETIPVVTQEQGEAFDRALSKLEREEIAVHEAGHVVAAHARGLSLCYARIGEVSEVQLCASDDPDALDDDDPKVERFQEYYAAGAAGERVIFGRYRLHGSKKDRCDVNVRETLKIQAKTGRAPDNIDVFDQYVDRVEARLSKEMVLAVATALKKKGFLGRDEILATLERIPWSFRDHCAAGRHKVGP